MIDNGRDSTVLGEGEFIHAKYYTSSPITEAPPLSLASTTELPVEMSPRPTGMLTKAEVDENLQSFANLPGRGPDRMPTSVILPQVPPKVDFVEKPENDNEYDTVAAAPADPTHLSSTGMKSSTLVLFALVPIVLYLWYDRR